MPLHCLWYCFWHRLQGGGFGSFYDHKSFSPNLPYDHCPKADHRVIARYGAIAFNIDLDVGHGSCLSLYGFYTTKLFILKGIGKHQFCLPGCPSTPRPFPNFPGTCPGVSFLPASCRILPPPRELPPTFLIFAAHYQELPLFLEYLLTASTFY